MIDRFRRRPNERDRKALERALATEKRQRREEIVTSLIGLGVLLIASIALTVGLHVDDIWFPQRPALWVSLAESIAFFVIVGAIGLFFGLPSLAKRGRVQYFDRQVMRMTHQAIETLRTALNGEVQVLRCDATDVVGIGDDDDVLWYAFQVEPNRIFIIDADIADMVGDEDPFPNTSFEVIASTSGEDDCLAVHCLGKRLRVRRVLATSTFPDNFEGEQTGRLEDLAAATV
jgi:hypothetical protein